MAKDRETAITVLAPVAEEAAQDAPFTHYVLVPVDDKGKENGKEFSISKKGFNQTFINRTAKPDGTATKPKFKVKKKK